MMRDKKGILILVLVLCFAIVSTPQIGIVKAQEAPIYIKEDGSIKPSTVPIQKNGNVYTFKNDIINYFLYIQCANIVIDGANYKLQGNGTFFRGVLVYRDNVTIKNMHISQFGSGIQLNSNNNTLFRNNLTENTYGLTISEFSSHNQILENNITNNMDKGIQLQGAGFNIIYGNEISNNGLGINIHSSGNNTIYHNNFVNNQDAVNDFAVYYSPWIESGPLVNIWDNGKEGNYWSNYNGTDNNGDGIGDTAHELYENNIDNFPLIQAVIIPEFPSWSILVFVVTVSAFLVALKAKKAGARNHGII
jgi:parallel beta-helix repeat protein